MELRVHGLGASAAARRLAGRGGSELLLGQVHLLLDCRRAGDGLATHGAELGEDRPTLRVAPACLGEARQLAPQGHAFVLELRHLPAPCCYVVVGARTAHGYLPFLKRFFMTDSLAAAPSGD